MVGGWKNSVIARDNLSFVQGNLRALVRRAV